MISQLLKITLVSSLLFLNSFAPTNTYTSAKKKTTWVWICLTKNAYAYHFDYDCHGLNRCKGEKKKVMIEDAKNKYERKVCGYEVK